MQDIFWTTTCYSLFCIPLNLYDQSSLKYLLYSSCRQRRPEKETTSCAEEADTEWEETGGSREQEAKEREGGEGATYTKQVDSRQGQVEIQARTWETKVYMYKTTGYRINPAQ